MAMGPFKQEIQRLKTDFGLFGSTERRSDANAVRNIESRLEREKGTVENMKKVVGPASQKDVETASKVLSTALSKVATFAVTLRWAVTLRGEAVAKTPEVEHTPTPRSP